MDRAGGWGDSVNRGQLNSFLGMPTDAGMHAASGSTAARGVTAAHGTADVRGAAVGTAGRDYAGGYGTHYFSPTYTHAQGLTAQRWWNGADVFTPGWAAGHPWGWCPGGYTAAAWATAASRTATWPAIGTWLGWNLTPAYYDYGENITYQNNYVYYGDQPAATTEQYYQQAVDLASANTATSSDETQWLPLGVFGLMADGNTSPQMVFQLAVDKAGVIRGNYYDQVADTTVPVSGSIDRKDQRVAWHVGVTEDLVIETGLYNLTQDQSTALVHYGADKTQQYVLVRLKQPPEGQQSPTGQQAE